MSYCEITSLSFDFLLMASLLSLGLVVSVGFVLLSGAQGAADGTEEMEGRDGYALLGGTDEGGSFEICKAPDRCAASAFGLGEGVTMKPASRSG